MVNIDDFIKRLEIILDYYGLNASAFADKIGVQRSSLSHLLSGRNKPSLDFILKILEEFPDVDLYWILNGKGQFPKTNGNQNVVDNITNTISKTETPTPAKENIESNDLFSEAVTIENKEIETSKKEIIEANIAASFSSDVEKIVFFYKDGTFKVFNSK
ncbi:helix-turn-helix domain-containing protein [Flavobacterium sp. NG2]|uniref:helix-turn-helix domain-containing protein n=1 Tax=Flavobacterium sp. NG2 TaxID=3097547 RepID=UPI002A7EFCFC|nr:helix-turn-helix domain-containing protein [Flavobacterium sp. NG2]WPR70679.1 helix-turn-helix domain-containing protein [Flavobacterium sp. NG2]